MKLRITPALSLLVAAAAALLATPFAHAVAFTGAQGYGANATGGTTVVHVTNLNDTGTGSLRAALSATGRKVVFDVAGTITIKSALVILSNTTIDGTTAPSPGITVTGYNTSCSNASNVIVRNLRFREDTTGPSGKCAFQGTVCHDIILDHCSIEWGRWDCLEFTSNSYNITVQFCIIGEGIDPQYFGNLLDSDDTMSIHHNLYIDNQERNPKFKCNGQYICNVVYNWGTGGGLIGGHSSAAWYGDIINNYFIAGPSSTTSKFIYNCASTDTWYQSGNYYDLNLNGSRDGTLIPASAFTALGVTLVSAAQHNPSVPVTVNSVTYTADLAVAGSLGCQPNDTVDKRLIGYLKTYGTAGQIGKP